MGDIFLFDSEAHKVGDKSLLKSSNESMVPGDSFLNYDLTEPFNVIEKALHITSLEYP